MVYDTAIITFQALTKYFFEIHDPTQVNGQGPDHGEQYLSAVFYYDEKQKQITLKLMKQLEEMGYHLATKLHPVSVFWRAETYHQDYYEKTGKQPYCHRYEKKFD